MTLSQRAAPIRRRVPRANRGDLHRLQQAVSMTSCPNAKSHDESAAPAFDSPQSTENVEEKRKNLIKEIRDSTTKVARVRLILSSATVGIASIAALVAFIAAGISSKEITINLGNDPRKTIFIIGALFVVVIFGCFCLAHVGGKAEGNAKAAEIELDSLKNGSLPADSTSSRMQMPDVKILPVRVKCDSVKVSRSAWFFTGMVASSLMRRS